MKIHTSDKLIAYLALLSGLTISAVAIYYSVAGLTAIFAAAVIPIIVMGVALEISKLAATVWLKQNWQRAPNFIRGYLLVAIAILMLITSMGIFGFLSKAHSDQSLVSGDVQSKIAVYDEKIKTEKENIEANRKALKQMDEAVDQVMGRSTDEKGADKAVALRRSQQKERGRLQNEISQSQKRIAELNDARAPIAAEVRKVEAEVGPIKYIASFVYGETNETILEKAVTWVIIIIVIVFDPLAVILLLASQYSFSWFRQQEEEEPQEEKRIEEIGPSEEMISDLYELENPPTEEKKSENPHPVGWMFPKYANIQEYRVEDADDEEFKGDGHDGMGSTLDDYPELKEDSKFDEKKPLDEWNEMIAEAEKAVQEEHEKEEEKIFSEAADTEQTAMSLWKKDNPDSSLKLQRQLLEKGIIHELPWLKYLKPQADFVDEAAEEARKWAKENPQTEEAEKAKEWADEKGHYIGLDSRPGDYVKPNEVSWMEHDEQGNQIKKTKEGYQQNAEQSERTIWQRIQDAKK